MSKDNPRQLYKERNQRVFDAIALKEPDRVPLTPLSHFFPMIQKGMTIREAMYDVEKSAKAAIEIFTSLNWDQVPTLGGNFSGKLFDALGVNLFKWPGAAEEKYRLKDNLPFQFIEGEFMMAEEYDDFFSDPTGFLVRKILPKHFSKLKGLSEFPGIGGMTNGFVSMLIISLFFSTPDFQKIISSVQEISKVFLKWVSVLKLYEKEMKKQGFPQQYSNTTQAPFDIVSDFLRGMRGSMLDMYRKPEELKRMLELLTKPSIEVTSQMAQMFPRYKIVFIPLHRGAEGFMNFTQFEEFYWPTLTKVMEGLIEDGLIPMPFFEGKYTDRFPYLAEFAKKHKGKMIFMFDQSDIIKGKEVFGNYVCIRGNVPASLLVIGNPLQVEAYVKKSIEGCAEGGGYLVDGGVAGIPNEAKFENVKAMTDAVFKYGVYRK